MKKQRKSVIARLTKFEYSRMNVLVDQMGLSKSEIVRWALKEFYEKHVSVEDEMWLCKCECGNEINVSRADLENGTVTSCGCDSSE